MVLRLISPSRVVTLQGSYVHGLRRFDCCLRAAPYSGRRKIICRVLLIEQMLQFWSPRPVSYAGCLGRESPSLVFVKDSFEAASPKPGFIVNIVTCAKLGSRKPCISTAPEDIECRSPKSVIFPSCSWSRQVLGESDSILE